MEDALIRARLAEHYPDALGWALSLCRYDRAEAENVLQTAYVNILSRRSTYREAASFRTWLFAVVRKTAAELRRQQWLRRWMPTPSAHVERAGAYAPAADAAVMHDQQARRLRLALAELPTRQREVLQLVFYHDLSIAEASQVMAVTLGTARRHYERGKAKLRQLLAADPDA